MSKTEAAERCIEVRLLMDAAVAKFEAACVAEDAARQRLARARVRQLKCGY